MTSLPASTFMFFPEGTEARQSDSEQRALAKWVQLLYDQNGPGIYLGQFPEGNRPTPNDSTEKLWKKANALRGN